MNLQGDIVANDHCKKQVKDLRKALSSKAADEIFKVCTAISVTLPALKITCKVI